MIAISDRLSERARVGTEAYYLSDAQGFNGWKNKTLLVGLQATAARTDLFKDTQIFAKI